VSQAKAYPGGMNCMTAVVFVDTNVIVYFRDATDSRKQQMAASWLDTLWEAQSGRLSFQVLNEYYVTVTKKLSQPLPASRAREDVEDLLAWNPIGISASLLADAWSIEDRFGFSWWDSLIVAAARASGSTHLLTEDLQHGQTVDGIKIVSPFAWDARELLGN
jgi:predicted nucleic acid-binding protein